MVQLNSKLQTSFRISKAYNIIGFTLSPLTILQAVSISSSLASHTCRSAFMTRILADPAEPWKDVSNYQIQLDPQRLIYTNHYEDISGKPLFIHNSQFTLS
jgi:hypothetical protein